MNAIDSRGCTWLQHTQPAVAEHAPCGRVDGWLVVQSHPQAERWAASNLTTRGYDTYLPLMAVRRRDRVMPTMARVVEVPLFSTYLFVRWPGHWVPIRYTPGVARLVSAGGKPNMASEAAVSAVRAAESEQAVLHQEAAEWAPGMACSLVMGGFADCPAIVLSVHDDTALVSLMMFGHLREVAVQLDNLVPRDED